MPRPGTISFRLSDRNRQALIERIAGRLGLDPVDRGTIPQVIDFALERAAFEGTWRTHFCEEKQDEVALQPGDTCQYCGIIAILRRNKLETE